MDFEFDRKEGMSVRAAVQIETEGIALWKFDFEWTKENAEKNDAFQVKWQIPALQTMYRWSPLLDVRKNISPDWGAKENAMVSKNAPVFALFDGKNQCHYLYQLSECRKSVTFHSGIVEENGNVVNFFRFETGQYTNEFKTTVILREDTRIRPLYDSLKEAAIWWEKDCNMPAAKVPAACYDPCYSFWYSFHQNVYEKDVEDECRRAKELGFDTCIIDDGWQTEDNSRGYAFCGDWQPAPGKICDMKAHVERVHRTGMKYVLWYAVPLIGPYCSHFKEFQYKLLRNLPHLRCSVLDPRYKEVREYLTGIYVKALKEWDLDGFKLDFIDQWAPSPENAPYKPEMDIPSLADASDAFMQETIGALKAVKPDVMLEFRQGYIGPVMREYGNMFRVADCPDDYLKNRVGVFDLRMMMGKSAVHSDMLMWHIEEKPEIAALQMYSVIYGVIQYSARLSLLTPEMKRMSSSVLDFARAHKNALLFGELHCYEPELQYTWAEGYDEKENVVTVYAVDHCVKPVLRDTLWILNGCMGERILADMTGTYQVTVYDCCGSVISDSKENLTGIRAISVPAAGRIKFVKM